MIEQLGELLAPLGIAYTPGKGSPGPDIGPFAKLGMRDALVDAGYGELAEREAPATKASGVLGRLLGR